jgi:hypothetical protein
MNYVTFKPTKDQPFQAPVHLPAEAWLNQPLDLVESLYRAASHTPESRHLLGCVPTYVNGEWGIFVVSEHLCIHFYAQSLNESAMSIIEMAPVTQPTCQAGRMARSYQKMDTLIEYCFELRRVNSFGCGDPFCWGVGSMYWYNKFLEMPRKTSFRVWLWSVLDIG